MNYINSFSIAGSTYICAPLKTDSSYNWGTYSANLYPSIASYNTNYTSIIGNDVLDGNILYSAHIIPAGSDTRYSGGIDVYDPYDVYTYEPDHVDFSVQSNFILNGSVSIWAHPTSSTLLSQEVVQGYISKHISYSNSIIFNDNIIVNCDTTNISIPSLFNDSRSEAYTIANNVLINTDFNLLSSYANKKTIIGGGLGKLATGVPPTVTALSSYPYLSTPAMFIGAGELTANTVDNGVFIGGNNFYYSVEVVTNSELATVVEDIGFVLPNETGSTEYPQSDVSIVYVRSYTDASHYSLGVKSGYYYSSFTSHNLPQYRKMSGYHFDGYYDNSGNMCSVLSDSYYCIKPTIYDISVELLEFKYPYYFTWQGGIGYGTWPGDTWSVITPPSIAESVPVTFRSISYVSSDYIEMGSEYDAYGRYATTMGMVMNPEEAYYPPIIGFATRKRPVEYSYHYDSYYSSSFIDSQGNSVWHWLFSRSYERNGGLESLSFHYTELPKLVIITPYTAHKYRLHIHKITTNNYEI